MLNVIRLLFAGLLWTVATAVVCAQDRDALYGAEAWCGLESGAWQQPSLTTGGSSVSVVFPDWDADMAAAWAAETEAAWARPSPMDTASRPKNKLSAKEARKAMTFAERNSGAFRSKKHGGVRSPGMAALCSAVVPGLGQCYNAQWYKPPVIYAGAAVIAYFVDFNLKEKRVYEKEVWARYEQDTLAFNPDLTGKSKDDLLRLRNYYEQNFELTLIIAGAVYLLNIIDAIVYAHLFDFNVSPNLAVRIEPYACPNFERRSRTLPMDMGFRLCMTFK